MEGDALLQEVRRTIAEAFVPLLHDSISYRHTGQLPHRGSALHLVRPGRDVHVIHRVKSKYGTMSMLVFVYAKCDDLRNAAWIWSNDIGK